MIGEDRRWKIEDGRNSMTKKRSGHIKEELYDEAGNWTLQVDDMFTTFFCYHH